MDKKLIFPTNIYLFKVNNRNNTGHKNDVKGVKGVDLVSL